ncbi:peroxisomal copper amine oxidase [Friedmanniomyces endolithicus]|uniref:Amine oxidase n=1 Tax=Friedmanniomyces endolithicus TaxID=329885 RepID=A0AAN6FWK8_9PEZI|nr:peroxisomal copper amine oxidase [Friedmanniomyces endolithicus]KAK0282565.1 peroxisomal copper amine oxidase [Friedmanniomyces endolithicus]KAK0324655.1 peroxisomal copper amine oxidase [Friedmanniomyces endolithicus]KAK0932130.1 peroxisomal copper amine oxidase [Friedmanniomyces endolithicus]KAK0992358.1 peroxisomal copper amine oxidase [Friedmanniomyces endolithicus]
MVLERLQQMASHLTGQVVQHHPSDPLTTEEIAAAVAVVRREYTDLFFNAVTLWEPRKAEMMKWLASPATMPRPHRVADVVAIGRGSKVYDGLVDLDDGIILGWEQTEGVQPLITMEDLNTVESVVRKDVKVIEQCGLIGIPPTDMHKVYCDPWTIGYDERFGSGVRLQQALMYYRPHVDDSQYTYPLDFCPIFNADTQEIVHIDIPKVRRQLNTAAPNNYHAEAIEKQGGFRKDLKPINITQPEGVSFTVEGRILKWQNWSVHVGFNYREGMVLSNITFNDKGTVRPVFWRMSLAEMVVPYGNPERPHQRKHAFDLGEYGGGYMTNSLALGCDCKGAIHYMDAAFVNRAGEPQTIKNAICIHEEDAGILFKHTDFRDESCTVTRARKLVVSHVFTAANYDSVSPVYCVYWIFHQDGTIQLEIKLTGILNTYSLNPGESAAPWGTEVYPGVNAHNHQHLFCLRVDPNVDGSDNTVFEVDAVQGEGEVGSEENPYGNAFYARKTKLATAGASMSDYNGSTSRTWDMSNTNKLNPYSKKPVSYKLVSREVPSLLPKEGSLVWKRAGFARHAVHVTKYDDDQIHPAGRHVPQTSGEPSQGLPAWIAADPSASLDNTDVVLWHTFGLTHFPSPEDYPVMPAEPMTVLFRPRNFFTQNPALDVPPSYSSSPSQVAAGKTGIRGIVDSISRLAFGGKQEKGGSGDCGGCN